MPWHWTDDLARILIESGRAEDSRLRAWLSAPVAVRSRDGDMAAVADSRLAEDGEEGEPPSLTAAA